MKSKVIVYKGVNPDDPREKKTGNDIELVDMNSKECNDLNLNSDIKICKVQRGWRDAFKASFKDRSPIIKFFDDK